MSPDNSVCLESSNYGGSMFTTISASACITKFKVSGFVRMEWKKLMNRIE